MSALSARCTSGIHTRAARLQGLGLGGAAALPFLHSVLKLRVFYLKQDYADNKLSKSIHCNVWKAKT